MASALSCGRRGALGLATGRSGCLAWPPAAAGPSVATAGPAQSPAAAAGNAAAGPRVPRPAAAARPCGSSEISGADGAVDSTGAARFASAASASGAAGAAPPTRRFFHRAPRALRGTPPAEGPAGLGGPPAPPLCARGRLSCAPRLASETVSAGGASAPPPPAPPSAAGAGAGALSACWAPPGAASVADASPKKSRHPSRAELNELSTDMRGRSQEERPPARWASRPSLE
mmetsp:Transcript_49940/g.129625  ORF Transcript_49940/g.129625 Transcript_49940/m.129625 type:complete len:230 (-) Transcript_49940:2035-2724(-)